MCRCWSLHTVRYIDSLFEAFSCRTGPHIVLSHNSDCSGCQPPGSIGCVNNQQYKLPVAYNQSAALGSLTGTYHAIKTVTYFGVYCTSKLPLLPRTRRYSHVTSLSVSAYVCPCKMLMANSTQTNISWPCPAFYVPVGPCHSVLTLLRAAPSITAQPPHIISSNIACCCSTSPYY